MDTGFFVASEALMMRVRDWQPSMLRLWIDWVAGVFSEVVYVGVASKHPESVFSPDSNSL